MIPLAAFWVSLNPWLSYYSFNENIHERQELARDLWDA